MGFYNRCHDDTVKGGLRFWYAALLHGYKRLFLIRGLVRTGTCMQCNNFSNGNATKKQSHNTPMEAQVHLPTRSRHWHYMGWGVRLTPRPLFTPRVRTPGTSWTGGWVGPRAGLDTEVRGKILLPLPGIEPRWPGRPARSQTLYCLGSPEVRLLSGK
jgi:hypothetical protein